MFRVASLSFFIASGLFIGCRSSNQSDADSGVSVPTDADNRPRPDSGPPPLHAEPTPAAIEYFSDINDTLMGQGLVTALHNKLASDHLELSYSDLYDAYENTDGDRNGCSGVFDFYSSKCWLPEEACGNYSREGDCFNREHSWPKSWWGGSEGADQHQDVIAVIPADGYVNGQRGQLPLGEVTNATYTSSNGSKAGSCRSIGISPSERCFEPPDELKGDLARIYFYMAVRYEGDLGCCNEISTDKADLKAWQEDQLRLWHDEDPVDIWERQRNERVFGLQKNRNPFVDFPVYVDRISDF